MYNEDLGKIKVIAKGARKITSKFTGHLETLNICTVSLYMAPRNIILTEIIADKNFIRIKRNLASVESALQIAEITEKILFENQVIDNLIRLIEKSIIHLGKTEDPSIIAISYIIKVLDRSGFLPDLEKSRILNKEQLKIIKFIRKNSLSEIEALKISQEDGKKLKQFTKKVLEHQTEKTFKSFID
jgi:DNA repair protein RecO